MKLKNIFTLLNSVIVIIMILLFMVLSVAVNNTNSELEWVVHTHDVINKAEGLMANMVDQETGIRGFLVTGDALYLDPYNEAIKSFDTEIDVLKITVDDNPAQVDRLHVIEALSNRWHSEVAEVYIAIKRESNSKDLYEELSKAQGKHIMDQIRYEVAEFVKVEEALLLERSIKYSKQHQLSLFAITFSIAVALVVGVIQYIVTKKVTGPLEKLTKRMRVFDPNNIDDVVIREKKTVYEVSELTTGYKKLIDELKISQNELHRLTRTDQLTDVYNRRWFDENLDLEWRRANRNNNELTLLMIDIDYFKNFNDTYGHVEGDACLKKVAAVIDNSLGRPMDNVVRFGGEEFAVLLPETDIDGGLIIAEKIRKNVEALGIENRRGDRMAVVTVSIGIACAHPSKGSNSETLLENADKAMYEAKKGGRNKSFQFSC